MDCSFPRNGRDCPGKGGNDQWAVRCNGRDRSNPHNRYVTIRGCPGALRNRLGLYLELPRPDSQLNSPWPAGHINFHKSHDRQCVVGPHCKGSRQEPSRKSRQSAHLLDRANLFDWDGDAGIRVPKPNCVSPTPSEWDSCISDCDKKCYPGR